MLIFSFIRTWRFWLPLAFLLILELLFRAGFWERYVSWNSHAGRTIVTKRSLQSIDTAQLDYVMLGDSRAHQGFNHRQLAQQARDYGQEYVDLALPGTHFLSLKVFSRYVHAEMPQLQGMILVIHPAFLQARGNGEYELGIVRPLRRYTSSRELIEHVPLKQENINTWGSLSDLIGYREDILQGLATGFTEQRVGNVNAGRWWLEWSAEYSNNLCSIDLAQADLCDAVQRVVSPSAEQRAVQQFCARPSVDEKMNANAIQRWREQDLPELRQAWRQFLGTLRAKHRLLVVSLPELDFFSQRELLPEALIESERLLQELATQAVIERLDLRQALAHTEQADCHYYRDPWHLNQDGQALMTQALQSYLAEHWYH